MIEPDRLHSTDVHAPKADRGAGTESRYAVLGHQFILDAVIMLVAEQPQGSADRRRRQQDNE